MRAFLDQPLGSSSRRIDIGFRVGVHQFDIDPEPIANHRRREVRAFLTGLADQPLQAALRQQHTDLQFVALRPNDIEGRQHRSGTTSEDKLAEFSAIHPSPTELSFRALRRRSG